MITSENYVAEVLRTESPITPELIERLTDPRTIRLLHGSIGACTESGELVDVLKKNIFYGKSIDFVNILEECGDLCWYIGIILDVLGITFNEALTLNINKLKKRYPEKFTSFDAINRDLVEERELLENNSDIK